MQETSTANPRCACTRKHSREQAPTEKVRWTISSLPKPNCSDTAHGSRAVNGRRSDSRAYISNNVFPPCNGPISPEKACAAQLPGHGWRAVRQSRCNAVRGVLKNGCPAGGHRHLAGEHAGVNPVPHFSSVSLVRNTSSRTVSDTSLGSRLRNIEHFPQQKRRRTRPEPILRCCLIWRHG